MAGLDGRRLDAMTAVYPTARPAPGAAEQSAGDWWRLVRAALDQFAAHPLAGQVAAIGVTSQVNTHLFCGADLVPLAPAITWQDTRAAAAGAALEARIAAADKLAALGAPIPIDASHALSRMAWIAEAHPGIWAKTAHVLLPKDWIIARLTGEVVADPLSAVGLAGADLGYAGRVLSLVPRAADLLPPLRDPLDIAGHIGPGLPFAGRPVVTGTMDAWASMFGLGVAAEGEAMYLSGSSEVLGVISATRTGRGAVVTFPPWRGITLHAAPTQSGGASLDWLCRLLGRDAAALSGLAAGAPIGRGSPLFLPHLEGERAPLWDPASRGGFAGLGAAHGAAEVTAAVMEGVAFSARLALEALEESAGHAVGQLRLGGGGAISDHWGQIRANALGRTLARAAEPAAGAVGALVIAGAGVGLFANLGAAARTLIREDRRFEPNAAAAALADERFASFRALYAALRPIGAAIG